MRTICLLCQEESIYIFYCAVECGNLFRYYDLKVGSGAEAVKGSRVAVRLWLSYIQFLSTWIEFFIKILSIICITQTNYDH